MGGPGSAPVIRINTGAQGGWTLEPSGPRPLGANTGRLPPKRHETSAPGAARGRVATNLSASNSSLLPGPT